MSRHSKIPLFLDLTDRRLILAEIVDLVIELKSDLGKEELFEGCEPLCLYGPPATESNAANTTYTR